MTPKPDPAAVRKHSLTVAGHVTSISLEDEFWTALKAAALQRGVSVPVLVGEIDAGRQSANLSSAIRVFLLRAARDGR